MEISSGVLGAVSASIAVPIIMGLLSKVKSLKPVIKTEKDFAQLVKEYSKWESFALVPFFIFTPLIGLLVWYFLDLVSKRIISNLGDNLYLFQPDSAIFAIPAIFMSILLAAVPMHFLYLGLLGKQRYAEYTDYTKLKHSLDGAKLLRFMAYICVPICVVFSGMALDSYLRVTENSFVSNDFLSLGERKHSFEDIQSIELTKSFKAPNGNILRRSYYTIKFTDGYDFDFKNSVIKIELEQQQEIISYIEKKSSALVKVNDPYPL